MDIELIKNNIKLVVNEKRYIHTLGVADVAYDLALIHGYDVDKAYLAGILHDCAKNVSNEDLVDICIKNNIAISGIEIKNIQLLHGKVGAHFAKTKYGVDDKDILNSIIYHTTGRPDMSMLEKIIIVADYIEPNRKPLPRINKIREVAFDSLDDALVLIIENVLNYLNETNALVDTITILTYKFYKEKEK